MWDSPSPSPSPKTNPSPNPSPTPTPNPNPNPDQVFRPEKLVECIVEFIGEEMGSEYTEIPPLDLNEAFADSKNR